MVVWVFLLLFFGVLFFFFGGGDIGSLFVYLIVACFILFLFLFFIINLYIYKK